MSKIQPVQLAFQFEETNPSGIFTLTRPLRKHRGHKNLLKKLTYVRRFFPDLVDRTIRIGLTRAASGMAVPGGDELWFNPGLVSYHTIAHEFVHLLQGSGNIPTGERSCDIFAMARHWTLNDTPPYYVKVPHEFLSDDGGLHSTAARIIYAIACRAVQTRNAGTRNYISYFERTLEQVGNNPSHPEVLLAF